MPNHIKNRLELKGEENRVNELIEKFSTHHPKKPHKSFDGDDTYTNKSGEFGWLNVETNTFRRREKPDQIGVPKGFKQHFNDAWDQMPDFNKVIQMPESLHIDSDGFVMPLENEFSRRDSFYETVLKLRNLPKERRSKTLENLLQGITNFVEHGHATWLGWARENWGTKWNSYSCKKESKNVFTFETAWSGVPNLISEIANQFEDVEIIYEYADEDTGSNCGKYHFHNGVLTTKEIENQSTEAYELAFKLRPDYKEDFILVDGEYQYKDEE